MDDNFQPVNVPRSVFATKLSQQQIGYQRSTGVATFTTQTPHTHNRLTASIPRQPGKPVPEGQTILGSSAAGDDTGGRGTNQNSNTCKAPVGSPP